MLELLMFGLGSLVVGILGLIFSVNAETGGPATEQLKEYMERKPY